MVISVKMRQCGFIQFSYVVSMLTTGINAELLGEMSCLEETLRM